MKLLHTGDWHIGKVVNNYHLIEEQADLLDQLARLIEIEKPDALIIAGDLYDRSVPPVEAVDALDRFLTRVLLEYRIPVLAIAGNHDSADRISFMGEILQHAGLYIEGRLREPVRKVELEDEFGPVHVYLLPYAHPSVVRDLLEQPEIQDHDSAMKAILDRLTAHLDASVRNVLVAHGYIRGDADPELSESEKPLSIGGTEYVKAEYFSPFHYTALGHLHGSQRAGSDRIRYAGSLMRYSFSEVRQQKSVSLVNIDGAGNLLIEERALTPRRDFRKIKGSLKDLLDPAVYTDGNPEDYLHVTLTDEGEILDPMNKLRAVYPNVMELKRASQELPDGEFQMSAGQDFRRRSTLDLFGEFFQAMTCQKLTPQQEKVIGDIVEEIHRSEGGQ